MTDNTQIEKALRMVETAEANLKSAKQILEKLVPNRRSSLPNKKPNSSSRIGRSASILDCWAEWLRADGYAFSKSLKSWFYIKNIILQANIQDKGALIRQKPYGRSGMIYRERA